MTDQTKDTDQKPADQATDQPGALQSEDAGMAFGYSGNEPEKTEPATPAPAEPAKTEAAPAAKTEPQKPSAPQPDAPLTRADVENLLNGRFRNFSGNVNKMLDERFKAFTPEAVAAASAAAKADGGAAPTNAQVAAAMTSTAKMKELEQDFPEFAAAMKEQAAALKDDILKNLPKSEAVDPTKFVPVDKFKSVEERLFDVTVNQVHPGWKAKLDTPEFADWLKAQPADVIALGQSADPEDGIKFMDKFFEHEKGQAKPQATPRAQSTQSRLAASVAPSTGANKVTQKPMTEDDGLKYGYSVT